MNDVVALMATMMKRELYVILSEAIVPPSDLQTNLESHLRYMIALEKSGILFASGPLFAADGVMTGDGMTVVRALSMEEAERIASADPFALAGQRRFIVKRWLLNEGRITVSVDVSNCGAALP